MEQQYDFYNFDGSRLTLLSGGGNSGSVFGTESESWAKIESQGWLGSGPEYFTVWMKDGTICEYGRESNPNQLNNSRLLNNAGNEVLSWKVNKITDVHGNYMSFHYRNDGGEHRIAGIWYTGSAPLNKLPYQRIDFLYSERQDQNTIYEGGSAYKSNFLLTRMVCYATNSDIARTYSIGYKFTDGYSFLQSVEECGVVGNVCFNELQFVYGDLTNPFLKTSLSGLHNTQPHYLGPPNYINEVGDFNGDGLSDIVQYRQALVNGKYILTYLEIKLRDYLGANTSFLQGYTHSLQGQQYAHNNTTPNSYNFHLADFDGDGTDDILLFHVNNGILVKAEIISKLYHNFNPTHTFFYPQPGWDKAWSGSKNSLVGDFNGDGRMDFLASLSDGTGSKLFITCPFKNPSTQAFEEIKFAQGSLAINSYYPGRQVLDAYFTATIDFDGDGRNEVLAVDKDYLSAAVRKARIFSFGLNQWGTWEAQSRYEAGYPTELHTILIGDFNGDRKTDLLTRTNDRNRVWEIATSTGTNFEKEALSFPFDPYYRQGNEYKGGDHEETVLISDYDGDGKSDILWGEKIWHPSVLYNFNTYFSRGKNRWKLNTNNYSGVLGDYELIGDFTGDGKADLVVYDQDFSMFSFREDSKDRLLSTTRNGLGRQSGVKFRNLTGRDVRFYESTAPTDYPFNTITVPYYAVSEVGSGPLFADELKRYKYKRLRFHKGGKGIAGFEHSEVLDVHSNTQSVSKSFNWHPSLFVPRTTETEVTNVASGGSVPITKTTNYYVTTPISGSSFRFKHQLDWMQTNDLLKGTYHSKRLWYDTYGNIRQSAFEINGWFEDGYEVNEYSPAALTKTPVPSKLSSVTTTHKRNDIFPTPVTTKTTYTYNNGKLIQKKEFDNLPIKVITNYVNHTVGLPTSVTVSSNGLSRTSSKGYDPLFRFSTSTTNALGESVSATYDYRWGVPLTQTSIDYQTTTFAYDGFGRLTGTTVPEGYTIDQKYSWNTSGGDTRYRDSIIHPGHGITSTGYDDRGRERESSKSMWGSGSNTLWSTSTKSYNLDGQILLETAPRFSTEPALNTSYVYDGLNRISKINSPVGPTSYKYVYGTGTGGGTLKVEITDPASHKTATETDAAGRVLTSITEGGVVRYSYDSWGNAKMTSVGIGNSYNVISNYDDYNRRISHFEPNSGITNYTYNSFGEPLTETDAAGKLTTTSYDVLGRVYQRIGEEGTTTYEYWPAGYGGMAGRLKSITGFGAGQQTDYYYNSFGQNSYIGETLNGVLQASSYTYDGYGRLSTTTYPNNGPVISNLYNDHGLLKTIINGTATIYTSQDVLYDIQSINGQGQTRTATRANGLSTTNTYHQFGSLLNTVTPGAGGAGSPKVQNYTLTYNFAKGVVTGRQDNAMGLNVWEAFSYDAANRLETATITNPFAPAPVVQVIGYGTGGSADNIIQKSDIGQFKYEGKPHAISYTDNSASQISVQTQEVRYTPFHRPDTLIEDDWMLTFQYGADFERRQTDLYHGGNLEETRWYYGSGSERHENSTTGTSRDLFYIPGPDGVAAIIKREAGEEQIYFPYADHLGSITALTDEWGNVVCRQSFDPWGRRRDPANWVIDDNALPADYSWLRGFTGHEHLPQFGLINMNARLYDPLLGRMLSPDNYVTDASDPMTYNLYSYANNNPLSHIDPSGKFIWFVPVIFAAVNLGADLIANRGNMNLGQMAASAFMGAVAGTLSGGAAVLGGAGFSASTALGSALFGQAGRILPSLPLYESENFSIGLSPSMGIGTSGFTAGLSMNASGKVGDFVYSVSVSAGYNSGVSSLGDPAGSSYYGTVGAFAGVSDGHANYGLGLFTSGYTGKTGQRTGGFTAQIGDFSFRMDEDFFPGVGDGKDRYRTGSALVTYRVNEDLTLAFGGSMMTGMHTGEALKGGNPNSPRGRGMYDNCNEDLFNLRGGSMYGGAIYKGQAYFGGHNSEKTLHKVQNWIHEKVVKTSPFFENRMFHSRMYSYYGTYHTNYLFY